MCYHTGFCLTMNHRDDGLTSLCFTWHSKLVCRVCKKKASLWGVNEEEKGKERNLFAWHLPISFSLSSRVTSVTANPRVPVCILPTFWWPPKRPRGEDFHLSQKMEGKTTQGEYQLRKKKKEHIGIWKVIVFCVSKWRQCHLYSFLACTNYNISCLSICIPKLNYSLCEAYYKYRNLRCIGNGIRITYLNGVWINILIKTHI